MYRLAFSMLIVMLVPNVLHRSADFVTGRLRAFGVMRFLDDIQVEDDIGSPSGKRCHVDATVDWQTDVIPASLHVRFGYEYVVSGLRPGATVILQLVYSHPTIKAPDGRAWRKESYQGLYRAEPNGTVVGKIGYNLGEEYLLVSGDWTFEVWHGASRLASKTFRVVIPAE